MSSANCEFIETKPGEWHYLIEGCGFRNPIDWREESKAFGPFPTLARARRHLRDHHGNPDGPYVIPNKDFQPDEVTTRLLKDAVANVDSYKRWGFKPGEDEYEDMFEEDLDPANPENR